MWPTNLSLLANRDLNRILARSASEFGSGRAERLQDRIVDKCREIAEGLNHGHLRRDITTMRPTRFLVVRPFVIVYNPETRQVIRIVDGRRDLARLF